jgi:3-isopropylmalate dehydrogenase
VTRAGRRRPAVVALGGDGIGPEVTAAAVRVLRAACDCDVSERAVGAASIDADGVPLTADVLAECREADAIVFGAVGTGRHYATQAPRPEEGLGRLRRELGLDVSLRPVRLLEPLACTSPLRPERVAGMDLLLVRELAGGLYGPGHGRCGDVAVDRCEYTRAQVVRAAVVAFDAAIQRGQVVSAIYHRPAMATALLWRSVVEDVASEYPTVPLEHLSVRQGLERLLGEPASLGVVLAENTLGDVLSDAAAGVVGSLGVLPSAELGPSGPGIFSPVHGSAPDIAGRGIANPVGAILSVAMLLRDGLDEPSAARAVEDAVLDALTAGLRTPDLAPKGPAADCETVTDRVLAALVGG